MSSFCRLYSHPAMVSLALCASLLGLAGHAFSMEFNSMDLARDGQTQYVLVTATSATPAEQFAARELRSHLEQVTGAEFVVIPETASFHPHRAVYIGWTDFARESGIELASLGDEEWIIRSVGPHLVLCGGRPRGTLYAVYEFLEAQVGCHWLDESTQIIPVFPTLLLKPLNIHGKPAFWDRHIYTGTADSTESLTLRARNKDTRATRPEFGFGRSLGSHTFHSYAQEFPSNHPEYLALDRAGNRPLSTSGSGPGQICLTHPEVRKLMLQRLKRLITEDRAAVAADAGTGRKPPRVYFVEQNDNHWICQCPTCQAFSAREEADSGPLIDLVNHLADGVRDEFPEVLVETFAYANTIKPPKTIRPRENVIIRLAQLNAEFATDAIGKTNWSPAQYPDMFRPMTHAINRPADDLLTNWSRAAQHLAYWDYWVKYSDKYPLPSVNVSTLQPDLKRFRDYGVEMMFTECERADTSSFFALKRWLGWKLMQNPDQDSATLIQTFLDGFYGPAAGKMAEYLSFLETRIAAVPAETGKLSALKTDEWPYLDRDFYETCTRLFDDAEALCGTDSSALVKVYRERLPLDYSLYCQWDRIAECLPSGETMPWTQDSVLRRYEANRRAELDFKGQTDQKHEEALQIELEKLRGFGNRERRF